LVRWSEAKDIAPDLFKLAWRKKLTLAQAMAQRKWMRGLQRLTTTEETRHFYSSGAGSIVSPSPTEKMSSPGDSQRMASTQRGPHTPCNSRAHLRTITGPKFGPPKQRTDASYSAGYFCRTNHGQLTASSNLEGKPTPSVNFVELTKNQPYTWWRNAHTLKWYGDPWRAGLE
jgi:hypothetical protein